ncbi:MAG: cytochrome P450 [Chloroflexi bacterium]|nr:cytochrome P450 [Chloroflexota bacterium]
MEDTVNRFKLWSPEVRADPHPIYAEMRAEAPLYRGLGPISGQPRWFFTRYEDCVEVLKDPRFIKDYRKFLSPEQREADRNDPENIIGYHMLSMDPPDHTRLRALVHKAFTPKMVENLRGRIAEIADGLIDDMVAQGRQADLIQTYALPLPIIVIAELLGVTTERRAEFRDWIKAIMWDSNDASRIAAVGAFVQYCNELIAQRRADPQDDLVSALTNVSEEDDQLSHEEILSMIFLLLTAGHETTINLIGNGTLALIDHPDQRSALKEDPSLIHTAVEEMLRYEGPVEMTLARFAAEEIAWGGQTIGRGEMVFAVLLSADRDETVFPDPNRFDITRRPNKHIAFGAGIHYCLGAPLARLEASIAFPTLLQRLPDLALATPRDQLQWNDTLLFRGMATLPVTY